MSKKNSKEAQRKRLVARRDRLDQRKPVGKPEGETDALAKPTSLPEKLVGVKYLKMLQKHLSQLRNEENQHGNRSLFLDDVFVVYLLAFFNPCIRSLRTLEDLSQVDSVQQHLSVQKVCKSTLSDFNKLIEPERLEPVLAGDCARN